LKLFLFLPIFLMSQAPPDDEPTVPIDNYNIPVLLLIVLVSYLVFKSNTNTLTNEK
jgi:hypothetical protein